MSKSGFVYFVQELDQAVYVGWSGDVGKRLASHIRAGRKLVAILPGTGRGDGTAENLIHDWFRDLRVRPSTYDGDAIWEYIEWLLTSRLAYRTMEAAEQAPEVPFEHWHPKRIENPWTGVDGQASLIASNIEPRERVQYLSQLIHLQSASDEWYTPVVILEMAREAMGSIDTDPASCPTAQENVKAKVWYSRQIDGLQRELPWSGNVWLNPPYGRGENNAAAFIIRLRDELLAGNVTQAITCLNVGSTTAHWFDPIWLNASAHLFWRGRIAFLNTGRDDSTPSKGTVFSYFGPTPENFLRVFGPNGAAFSRALGATRFLEAANG